MGYCLDFMRKGKNGSVISGGRVGGRAERCGEWDQGDIQLGL